MGRAEDALQMMMIMFFGCQVLAVLLQNGCQCCVVCNRFLRHNHCRLSTAVPLTKAVNITVNSGFRERERGSSRIKHILREFFSAVLFLSFLFTFFPAVSAVCF